MATKQVLKQKVKKKWYPLYGPALFGNQLIGESYLEGSAALKGRFVSANLSTITNDMKKQNITVKLRVSKVVEGKGQTEIIGMQLVQGFVKRLVRRGRTKVDDSFVAKTKDGQLVRVKPLILTNTNCVTSTASQVRMQARALLLERLSMSGFVNAVQDILNFRLQKDIKEQLNKIHPIKSVDIRVFSRETVRGAVPEAELILMPEEQVQQAKEERKASQADDDYSEDDDDEPAAEEGSGAEGESGGEPSEDEPADGESPDEEEPSEGEEKKQD